MGYVRKRANGQLAFVFSWKGKKHAKALGTTEEQEADSIRREANEQLARIRRGESALASKLLADGHNILDVLFGSEKIAHLIDPPADDNPLILSELKAAFIDNLKATDRTPGHIEGTRVHLDHFIRVLGDVRLMSLADADMTAFQKRRAKEKTPSKRLVSRGTIRSDFKSLRSAVNWAMTRKPPLLVECSFTIPKITDTTVKPFLPTEVIKRLIESTPEDVRGDLLARWLLDLDEINQFIGTTGDKMPEMLLHGHAPYPVGAVEAERLREGAAHNYQQERCEGERSLGDQPDHRAKGFGGEGVAGAHQGVAEAQQNHVPDLR